MMKQNNLDQQWIHAHPMLSFVALACICFATMRVSVDIANLLQGSQPRWWDYIVALSVTGGAFIGNRVRRKKQEKREIMQNNTSEAICR